MQQNSNQQNFTVSIRAKREKLRAQVRRQQLQAYFRAKRIECFSKSKPKQKIDFFQDLQNRIKLCPFDFESLQQIQTEVRNLFNQNPEEEMNFHVLVQLIMKLPNKFFDFKNLIIHQDNLVFHSTDLFAKCFGVYFSFLIYQIEKNNQQANFVSEIEQIDMFLAAIIDSIFCNKNLKIDSQLLYCFQTYLVCCNSIISLMDSVDFFPICVFNSIILRLEDFYKKISNQKDIYLRDLKLRIAEFVNAVATNINQRKLCISEKPQFDEIAQVDYHPDYVIKNDCFQRYMKAVAIVIYENIQEISQERIQCYKSIQILSKWSAINAGEYLFTQKNIPEFIFRMMHQKLDISMTIVKSFEYVLPAMNNKKMGEILSESIHINLVKLFRKCLDEVHNSSQKQGRDSDSLFHVLKLIESLLGKTEAMGSIVYQKVFYQMDCNGFGDLMNSMNDRRYENKIEEVWGRMLDIYFSEQMQDESTDNNENSGDYMNIGASEQANGKQEYQYKNISHYQEEYDI